MGLCATGRMCGDKAKQTNEHAPDPETIHTAATVPEIYKLVCAFHWSVAIVVAIGMGK